MSTKHFIHDATILVESALESLEHLNPEVNVDRENKIVYRSAWDDSTVSIISGGGSGHEPSFGGFVGKGLLSATVAGTIFASPNSQQIVRCITSRVNKKHGVLVIVMNYTGDVLNFGMAVEKAKAVGVKAEMVVVGDDVGVGRKQGGKVGRRGIAGTVLVHKIAGALAATGASLEDVYVLARTVSENLVSIGASLSHVHVPGRETIDMGEDDLKISEVEIGMGIHNEPGSERRTEDLPSLVNFMLARLLDEADKDRNFLGISSNDEVVLLVNNLGGVSVLEMGGITNEIVSQLQADYRIKPKRVISGTFMTSLNGLGFSITLLKLQETGLFGGKSMLELLDSPSEALGWSTPVSTETWNSTSTRQSANIETDDGVSRQSNLTIDWDRANKALRSGLNRVIKAEPDITRFDTIVGDGDCGVGLKRGAESVLKTLDEMNRTTDALVYLDSITRAVESSMDGASGAIHAIFLNALSQGLQKRSEMSPRLIRISDWTNALDHSKKALSKYTPARPGDRTLIDALYPFIEVLAESQDTKTAATAAAEGATKTKGMRASLGRTVYVGGGGWQDVPDPGAHGLSEFLLGLSEEI